MHCLVVPFLGPTASIPGATVSAISTYYALSTALDAHKEIVQKTVEVVNELKNGQNMKKKDIQDAMFRNNWQKNWHYIISVK